MLMETLRITGLERGLSQALERWRAPRADGLLDDITALSAPGSRFITEYFSRHWQNSDVRYDTLEPQDQAAWDLLMREFRYSPVADRPGDWLSAHGWTPRKVTTLTEIGKPTGRPVPFEFSRPGAPQEWFFAGELPAAGA
jgi:O-methyltransferase involved in polyketide biosynthesis